MSNFDWPALMEINVVKAINRLDNGHRYWFVGQDCVDKVDERVERNNGL
jgi:hypothetical protein